MVRNEAQFNKFIDCIFKKNPLQKKAINRFLETRDEKYWVRSEMFARNILSFMEKRDISVEYIVDSYLKMCRDMLVEQIKFKKSGKYSCRESAHAEKNVYSSENRMKYYMYGLALSLFLWPNHYSMYDFFLRESEELEDVSSYLEIGPGHGLFLIESLKMFPSADFLAVDISSISIQISKELVQHFLGDPKCEFCVQDVNKMQTEKKYDYIVMNEVLEHLDDPEVILKKVHDMISDKGHFFMTTCANCPALDHVYLYDSVAHIRNQIEKCGFEIISDIPLAVGDFDENVWETEKVEINYAAMLKKA